LEEWFGKFEKQIKTPLGFTAGTLAKKLYGMNFAEAEEFGTTIYRQYVLEQPDADMKSIVNRTIKIWKTRTVKVDPQNGRTE
jgi:hypothetical protein